MSRATVAPSASLLDAMGPCWPVWRRRLATSVGALLVGLVALLFAELANLAISVFEARIASLRWLPLILTPIGVMTIALATRRFTPRARAPASRQVIAAAAIPKKSINSLISLRVGIAKLLMTAAGLCVLLGMIAYFTGVVRAPLTAVIIIAEATASRGMILPLLASALIADNTAKLVCKDKLHRALSREFVSRASP